MRRFACYCVLLALLPSVAYAESGAASDFIWKVANLVLLLAVLFYFGRKPVQRFLEERRDGIQENIAASQKLLDEAEGRLQQWNAKGARLDADVEHILDSARQAADQEAQAIVAHAKASADRIRQGAQAVVERELSVARKRLRTEAAELAVEVAGRVLAEQVSNGDRERLVDEFIHDLEARRDA